LRKILAMWYCNIYFLLTKTKIKILCNNFTKNYIFLLETICCGILLSSGNACRCL